MKSKILYIEPKPGEKVSKYNQKSIK